MKAKLIHDTKFIPVEIIIETDEEFQMLLQLLYVSTQHPVRDYIPNQSRLDQFIELKGRLYDILDKMRQSN